MEWSSMWLALDAVGSDFIMIYRLSVLDLVEGDSSLDEVIILGRPGIKSETGRSNHPSARSDYRR